MTDKVTLGTTQAGFIVGTYRITTAANAAGTVTNARERRVYVLPAWARHGTQPTYWSEIWLRKEKLADWDRVAGTVYEADNMEDVIRQLDEGLDAAQAN